jgi:hypothetical protein
MKRSHDKKKLSLTTETLRELNSAELEQANGGLTIKTLHSVCELPCRTLGAGCGVLTLMC